MAVIVQCPACRALVMVAAVQVDPARGAGLPCAACGAVTWLPAGDAAPTTAAPPTIAPSTIAPPPTTAPVAGAAPALDVTAQLVPALDAMPPPLPEQAPLDAAFRALLPVWHDAAAHTAFLQRASLTGELAFAGQRYRAALDRLPGDARAKKAQSDLLGLAMAQLNSGLGSEQRAGRPPWMTAAAVVLLLVSLVVLGWVVIEAFAFDGAGHPATVQ